MSSPNPGLAVGSVLAGRYQVRRELGRGGMGFVYLCRDLVIDERVALKLMPRSPNKTKQASHAKKKRNDDAWFFYEEARALASLFHPTIVHLRDYGVLSDGAPYLVMDVVPGRSLHEWIYRARTDGLLPWPVVWCTIDQVLAGLAHAHARGVIHGDLKPSNILLDRPPNDEPPRAYLLDLGLAWLMRDPVDHRLDGTREVAPTVRYGAGTPGWMAPEQIRMANPHIGPATDMYPLGCLLYTLLVGEEIFSGSNDELLEQHKNAPPPDFKLGDGIPIEVKYFLLRLLEKWPWKRFNFAGDARRLWREFKPEEKPESAKIPGRASSPSRSSGGLISDISGILESQHQEVRGTAPATPGLLGLRPSPFVARIPERDELRTAVKRVCNGDKANHQLVVLSGPAGVGKSRLAEWLCQEVHEHAFMLPLRARYRKIAAPLDGVVGAIIHHYRLEKAKRDTIEKVLINNWGVENDDDEGLTWVAGAATWLCRKKDEKDLLGPTKKRFVIDRPQTKWLVIRHCLERTARDKPILLWLDDVHRAPADTFKRLAQMRHDLSHVPMLLIATMRNEDVENDPTARARVELFLEEYGGHRMELEPLEFTDTETLLRETLPLSDKVIELTAKRAKGNPLFALQLLHSWALRGDLELQNGVYTVQEGAIDQSAKTTADLWEVRLQTLPEELQPAAFAAAALGGDIRREVLRVLLTSLDIDAGRAINAMKRAQLLHLSGTDRLRWVHALLQEYLLQGLSAQANAKDVFRRAAAALAHHPAGHNRRVVRHRVTNLIRADEIATAAELLHQYIATAWSRVRDASATVRDLQLLDGRLSGHHLARHLRWRSEAQRHSGELESARREAEQARRLFRDHGDTLNEAQCLRLQGHIASDLGASAQGRRLVLRALNLFTSHGDGIGQAQCEVLLGEIDYLLGEHQRARELLDQAATRFEQLGEVLGRAQCLILLGFVKEAGGAPQEARTLLNTARTDLEKIGYRLGVAQCDLALAHADHHEGNFSRAHQRATETLKAFRLIENPRGEAGCERLLAMNALDGEHPNTAEVHARAAGVLYSRLNDPWGKVEALLLLAQVALSRRQIDVARDALIRCEAVALVEAEPKQHRHLTLAWLAFAEDRQQDIVRELDAARRTFKDSSQSGDHTPHLLERFKRMDWPEPAASRVANWLASIRHPH